MMKLRFAAASPFVRKVVVVSLETGLSERIERVSTSVSPVQPNEEMARENPLIKVPSLTTDDGTVLYNSPVICEYLDTLHDGPKLFPASGPARWTALRQQALADGLLEAAILMRYENLRPEEKRWQDWVDSQMRRVRGALAALEIETEAGALGGPLTIGHVTVGCALGYLDFRFAGEEWRMRHRQLAAWFARIQPAQVDAAHHATRRLMASADEIVAALDLKPHPEGGWYRETYRGDAPAGGRAATTAIYYLLRRGERSHWHRVDASEIWHWYAGDPLELRIGRDTVKLGGDIAAGERPQAVVPPFAWQAARSLGAWTLVGCTVAPAFEFAGFELAPPGWEPKEET